MKVWKFINEITTSADAGDNLLPHRFMKRIIRRKLPEGEAFIKILKEEYEDGGHSVSGS